MPKTLENFDAVILSNLAHHLPTAKCVRNLSLVSKKLRAFVEEDGWRVFVLSRFPSITVPRGRWEDGAHALTTLSRNIDRRAFIATELRPYNRIHCLPEGTIKESIRKPQGQSMGYQAKVDSYEEWQGGDWASRREVVAWGAGADVIMKTTRRHSAATLTNEAKADLDDKNEVFLKHDHSSCTWLLYHQPGSQEGRDDVIALKNVQPWKLEGITDGSDKVIVGRANGKLELLQLAPSVSHCLVKSYSTGNSPVRSADVSEHSNPLLAAGFRNGQVKVYRVNEEGPCVNPISKIDCASIENETLFPWSAPTEFLGKDILGVGLGVPDTPIAVYDVGNLGIGEQPLRTFSFPKSRDSYGQCSTTALAKLPEGDESASKAFLTGGYDGFVRLHDLRSPRDVELSICDKLELSTIFSLTTIGRERIVAGMGDHSLICVFDMRMAGGRAYSYIDGTRPPKLDTEFYDGSESGWTVDGYNSILDSSFGIYAERTRRKSPVYSLSRPSASSPFLFVGTEGGVAQLNFTGMHDAHPDPLFRARIRNNDRGRFDPMQTWESPSGAKKGGQYHFYVREQDPAGGIRLFKQQDVPRLGEVHRTNQSRARRENRFVEGYDEKLVQSTNID